MTTTAVITPKKILRTIRPATRKSYKTWIKQAETCDARHHVARRKLLAAAQQAMELADGEKEWAQAALKSAAFWANKKGSPNAEYRILLHYDCKVGGSPGHYGRAVYYQVCFARSLDRDSVAVYIGGAGRSDASTNVGD